MSDLENFLLKYPGFSQSFFDKYIFYGNLKIKEHHFYIEFRIPFFPNTQDINGYITKCLDIYQLPKNNCNLEINEYMSSLNNYLQEIVNSKYSQTVDVAQFTVFDLSEELKKLENYKCKTYINKQQTLIRFTNFERYPGHQLDLNIKSKQGIQIKAHSVPDCILNNEIFRHTNSIESFLQQFLQILEQLEEFYDNLNTIDELCNVVEPVDITLKHNWRIFKLNEKVFIKITAVNPLIPSAIDVNLFGPTQEVEKYREMYNERAKNWDVDLDIHKNLLRIFNLMYFPMNNRVIKESDGENEKHCNICFLYRLNNHIPIISCDNLKCDVIFHVHCLKQWFSTLLDEKQFLNVNLGTCPFCKKELSTSFVQLLEM